MSSACGCFSVDTSGTSQNLFGCSTLPNEFSMNFEGSCFDNLSVMYDSVLTNAYNSFSPSCTYYILSYDTDKDPLFGEDDGQNILRKFPVKVQFELPPEEDLYAKFGVEGLDNFHMYISKTHFTQASMLDTSGTCFYTSGTLTSAYEPTVPMAGDIIRTDYNCRYYEILNVKEGTEEQFLNRKHVWDLIVRKMKDQSYGYVPETSAALVDIQNINDVSDIFDNKDLVITSAGIINYETSAGETDSAQDDLNGWFDS